jgi:hypothetical protein
MERMKYFQVALTIIVLMILSVFCSLELKPDWIMVFPGWILVLLNDIKRLNE